MWGDNTSADDSSWPWEAKMTVTLLSSLEPQVLMLGAVCPLTHTHTVYILHLACWNPHSTRPFLLSLTASWNWQLQYCFGAHLLTIRMQFSLIRSRNLAGGRGVYLSLGVKAPFLDDPGGSPWGTAQGWVGQNNVILWKKKWLIYPCLSFIPQGSMQWDKWHNKAYLNFIYSALGCC